MPLPGIPFVLCQGLASCHAAIGLLNEIDSRSTPLTCSLDTHSGGFVGKSAPLVCYLQPVAVYDVVPFNNEVDLLLLRMGILEPWVDYFVISEASTTFSGNVKPMRFAENAELFANYADKIIYNAVSTETSGSTFERDRFQKDTIKHVLSARCRGSDLVIFSDVDEIPNPNKLGQAFDIAKSGRMAHFAQDLFYYYLNMQETSGRFPSITGDYPGIKDRKWLGSRIVNWEYLIPYSMTELRDPFHKKDGSRIENGGWHFSYCGGEPESSTEDRLKQKILDTAHQELVNERTISMLPRRLKKLKDPLGRRRMKLRYVPIDGRYPNYLRDHLGEYEHMILKP